MTREGLLHPRWVQRSEERRAGRYEGDKVVRWIAKPNLLKKRAPNAAEAPKSGDGAGNRPPRHGPNGFTGLRLVSNR